MTIEPSIPRANRPGYRLAAVAALVVLVGGGVWCWRSRPAVQAERLLAQARSLQSAGNEREAERTAAAAWESDPTLGEAALLAAECAAAGGESRRAIDHLARIVAGERPLRLRAALLAARLNRHGLYRFSDAERAYRRALDLDPDNFEANSGLANLLGLCGRAREAVPFVLRVVRLGEPTDLLVLVARVDGVVHDSSALEQAHAAAPDDANPLIGMAWHAASAEQPDQAIRLLREAIALEPQLPAAHVALGKQLLAARRFDELATWARALPAGADDFAETWLVRARAAENAGDVPGAIRCNWEALRRGPEYKSAHLSLSRLLAESGAARASRLFADRVRRLQDLEEMQTRVLFSNNGEGIEPLLELANRYEATGRLWEACGWCRMAVEADPHHKSARRYLAKLRKAVEGLSLRLTDDDENPALAVDLSTYPLPRIEQTSVLPVGAEPDAPSAMSFDDVAATVGLRFRFFNGGSGPSRHRMFEFTGGGIGVLDFDLDGFADVYFTQGRPWPPATRAGGGGDRLFRNLSGARFDDVTEKAGIREGGFGQGVAVGDYDADGFPDLYAAHIGANQLWKNNGDGTFFDATSEAGVRGNADDWTTSCIMADLDGDGLPDIYAVTYVTAPDVFDRVCRQPDGNAIICMPFDFNGQPDRFWINDGNGQFTDASGDAIAVDGRGKGLGVAAWNADGTGRLSLLVANDTTPNFFFVREPAGDGRPLLYDRGIESGLAFNGEGKATGCMGVAVGDADGDGRMDVHITNFLGEPNTLFLGLGGGAYEDRTREWGLHYPTIELLGFGTQFLDANLDGRLELFATNGHIDDFRRYGKPYRMPPKMFERRQRRFVEVDADRLGPYFQQQWLGRSVARLDWNRDGRDDLVVGHLVDDSSLLTNTTPDAGRFLSMRLFGVQSNRDAIGTEVSARVGETTIVRQMTAGDGYQASNERRLIFGVGNAQEIDELIIRWPAGTVQRFEGVPTSREVWLREGHSLVAKFRPGE